jgi:hypothetical protein
MEAKLRRRRRRWKKKRRKLRMKMKKTKTMRSMVATPAAASELAEPRAIGITFSFFIVGGGYEPEEGDRLFPGFHSANNRCSCFEISLDRD